MAALVTFPGKDITEVVAVGAFLGASGKSSQGREQVELGNQGIRNSRFYFTLPVNDKRHTCTRFEEAVFSSAQRSCRFMTSQFFNSIIVITIVYNRAVVDRK